jgi:hypothetical protein
MGIAWTLVALAWAGLFATMAFPIEKLNIATLNLFTYPHGVAVLWTGRLTFILAACVLTTALALHREHKQSLSASS